MTPLIKVTHTLPDDNERLAILNYTGSTVLNFAIEDTTLMEIANSILTIENELNSANTKVRSNPLTMDIGESHIIRLECIENIKNGISYFLGHEDKGKVIKAEKLATVFAKFFGNLPDKKRVTYTVATRNFLEAIKDPDCSIALDELEMTEKIERLSSAQTNFISFRKERAQKEEFDPSRSIKDIRADAHKLIEVLEHHLYHKQYIGMSEYEELTVKLNGSISDMLTTAKSRLTHEINEDKNEQLHDTENAPDIHESLEELHEELHEEIDENKTGEL